MDAEDEDYHNILLLECDAGCILVRPMTKALWLVSFQVLGILTKLIPFGQGDWEVWISSSCFLNTNWLIESNFRVI